MKQKDDERLDTLDARKEQKYLSEAEAHIAVVKAGADYWRKVRTWAGNSADIRPVRTRFAPSPTGFLHIGGARTALFSWAYARRHGGAFILRIEDTDVARSTPEAVQAILDGMKWLGLAHDEGPFYQMQRMDRYKAGDRGDAGGGHGLSLLHLEGGTRRAARRAAMARARSRATTAAGARAGRTLPPPPAGVPPVVRFRNPLGGVVAWDDQVKGRIEFANGELDDLIIARADGTPTYNFCVVVDDCDMGITHVIRGDDHVNNTPRQINILQALGAPVPQYAHLSMILGDDGQKLSKRHGAVSVMQYEEDGYLPEAVLNYLARLGWSHGDEEVFGMEQFVQWFDLDHITASAAQFNTEKLNWLNAHYLKPWCCSTATARPTSTNWPMPSIPSFAVPKPSAEVAAQHLTEAALKGLAALRKRFAGCAWQAAELGPAVKQTAAECGLKMPQLAIPLRVALLGMPQSPAIDAVLEVMGRERVLARLAAVLPG
jgi:glutamyl-tRNA synthetase